MYNQADVAASFQKAVVDVLVSHSLHAVKAYQKTTGIAGYTLVYNSYGLKLVTHLPFMSFFVVSLSKVEINYNLADCFIKQL